MTIRGGLLARPTGQGGGRGSATAWAGLARLAFRDLRGGVRGFAVFIACVALGVAVITGVGALADGLRAGFERQGGALLGGDVTMSRPHRRAEPGERAWMEARSRVSEVATLRAMARRLDGADEVLVELKGVDGAYPLAGELRLVRGSEPGSASRAGGGDPKQRPGQASGAGRTDAGAPILPAEALAGRSAAVDPILLERLSLKTGDRMRLGLAEVEVRAVVAGEPDRINDRMTFGPRVLVSNETLLASGLADPGSLVRWRYALQLSGPTDAANLAAFREQVRLAHPDAGFTVADKRDPSPQVTRTLERLRQFLTLIGLTSLLVGGVGVANAVATWIDRRRRTIAIFKSVGASGRQIFALHLAQMLAITGLGIAAGLAVGLLLPGLAQRLAGDALPVELSFTVGPASILSAVAYGLLVALLFTLWPLGRASEIRAGVLFRDEVAPGRARPRWPVVAATVAVALALVGLAVATSESKRIALYFCGALAGIFLVFLGLGQLITVLARLSPRPRRPELRLALASIAAPGGLARSVVLSLGSGLSLLVAVALADAAIVDELETRLPRSSPDFFMLDVPRAEAESFAALVQREVPGAQVNQAPMLRGRLVRLAGRPVDQVKVPPEVSWVLSGDRGLSYADTVPEGSRVVAGSWWPADHAGEPLVSFEADIARQLGLKLGDKVAVNVLGRTVEATISNLREVRWESLAINFVMVFSPSTLAGAPHNLLATISLPKTTPLAQEAGLAREIGRAFPQVTTIRVRDAIDAFNAVFGRIMVAVRVAGSITLVAGGLVLAGALATAQRRRIKQAVIVKVLGGTRARIMAAHAAEYVALALAASLFAIGLGAAAAWAALTRIMDVPFVFSGRAVAMALGIALALVLVLGGVGTWRVLAARPVPHLRSE